VEFPRSLSRVQPRDLTSHPSLPRQASRDEIGPKSETSNRHSKLLDLELSAAKSSTSHFLIDNFCSDVAAAKRPGYLLPFHEPYSLAAGNTWGTLDARRQPTDSMWLSWRRNGDPVRLVCQATNIGIQMSVTAASDKNSADWDTFVSGHDHSANYHRWAWKRVIEQAFGWKTFYLMAEENGKISGVLPLVWLKSRLFGNLMCSLPFFSEAGLVADSSEAVDALLAEAIRVARDVKAEYIELRHRGESPVSWPAKSSKVTLECDVHPDPEENMRRLSTKMRTNIRRSLKLGLEAEFGREEFLEDFYEVFCLKMRELGTPVYTRKFFETILGSFPRESFIGRVRHQGKTVAAGFLTGWRGSMEANWSAASPKAMNLRPNMFLFWQMLCFAGQKGYRVFDFGRSTVGSGTYEFKQQWNTRVVPLYWNYWNSSGEQALELNPDNPRYRAAIWAWQWLPIVITKWIGPPIARCLP
jgi:serine/alanine adding enzyme